MGGGFGGDEGSLAIDRPRLNASVKSSVTNSVALPAPR
jgi:hypothetical protein